MSGPSPVAGRSQSFLSGPTLYLRPVEPGDAATAVRWYPSPYPVPTEILEKRLCTRLEANPDTSERRLFLLVCRHDDDVPVGSVETLTRDGRWSDVKMTIDPLLTDGDQADIAGNILDILIPWMLGERGEMFVVVFDQSDRPGVEARVAQLGGRVAVRHRERLLVRGDRRDGVFYQFFSPWWRSVLGDPPNVPDGQEARFRANFPISAAPVSLDDRPPDVSLMSERLVLRPFRSEDGAQVAGWALEETEHFYAEGRLVVSGHSFTAYHTSMAESDPPAILRFAVALKESGQVIGAVGFEGIDWINGNAVTETELFHRDFRNRGYGTEAKALLLDYAFGTLGLHMVYSFVAETNPRSAAALRKQGYRQAGLIAWDSFTAGGLSGFWSYDLLASEWRDLRSAAPGQLEIT